LIDAVVYSTHRTRTETLLTRTSADGSFTVSNTSATSPVTIAVDVSGWYGVSGLSYWSRKGVRVLDTHAGVGATGAVTNGRTIAFAVRGKAGVPTAARAVALQLTAVRPTAQSSATLWPTGTSRPGGQQLSTEVARSTTQYVTVPIGSNGTVSLRGVGGTAEYQAAVVGWWLPTTHVGTVTPIGSDTPVSVKTRYRVTSRLTTSSVVLPSRTVVTGSVVPAAAAKGKRVAVQQWSGKVWRSVGSAKVDVKGHFSLAVAPATNGRFVLRVHKGNDGCRGKVCAFGGAVSKPLRLTVARRMSVSASFAGTRVTAGSLVISYGTVPGAPTGSPVRLQIYSKGAWHVVSSAALGSGSFLFTVWAGRSGRYAYRVMAPSTQCVGSSCLLLTGWSKPVAVTVN
jgi:hypothetical protein